MTQNRPSEASSSSPREQTRRHFLRASAATGGAILAAPYIGNAEAAKITTWKIQTSWPGGIGLQVFKDWCNSIIEKTGGELAFQPFGVKDVVGKFQLFDAVKNGVLDGMNPFTLYWAGRMPVAVFLASNPWACTTRMNGIPFIMVSAGWSWPAKHSATWGCTSSVRSITVPISSIPRCRSAPSRTSRAARVLATQVQ